MPRPRPSPITMLEMRFQLPHRFRFGSETITVQAVFRTWSKATARISRASNPQFIFEVRTDAGCFELVQTLRDNSWTAESLARTAKQTPPHQVAEAVK